VIQLYTYLQSRLAVHTDRERGATAVEYGLLVALIAAVIIGTVGILGGKVDDAFKSVSDLL
jgi:pilus assembly protein Flp/PilA